MYCNDMTILKISKQIYQKNMLKQQGFLLLELMVALTLLMFFMYLMYHYQGMNIKTYSASLHTYQAANHIHSFLVQARFDPLLLKKKSYRKDGYTLTWQKHEFPFKKTKFLQDISSSIQCLVVQAQWTGWDKKNYTMSVTSGIAS